MWCAGWGCVIGARPMMRSISARLVLSLALFAALRVCGAEFFVGPTGRDAKGTLKFSFGTNEPAPSFTGVTPATFYNPKLGHGFEPGATVTPLGRCVASDTPFLFSVRLPEGNYAVTIAL